MSSFNLQIKKDSYCEECNTIDYFNDFWNMTSEIKECSICLNDISGENKKLQCGHIFHEECINKWNENTCPYCRCIINKDKDNAVFIYHPDVFVYMPQDITFSNQNSNINDGVTLFGIMFVMTETFCTKEIALFSLKHFNNDINKTVEYLLYKDNLFNNQTINPPHFYVSNKQLTDSRSHGILIEEQDIFLVMQQTSNTRVESIQSLIENNSDLVNAIMDLQI